jgi:hypothetical protein
MMRLVAVAAAVGALLVGIGAQAGKQSEQQPDKRLFFVVNADGYGVDHCLSSSTACGTTVANAYCHAHEYAQALSFRKVEPGDSSGAITANRPADASCSGRGCGEFVAIECSR